jgi:hypothetical protein
MLHFWPIQTWGNTLWPMDGLHDSQVILTFITITQIGFVAAFTIFCRGEFANFVYAAHRSSQSDISFLQFIIFTALI